MMFQVLWIFVLVLVLFVVGGDFLKALIKHLGVMVIAAITGCYLYSVGSIELAGVCIGVVGTYAIKNGVKTD